MKKIKLMFGGIVMALMLSACGSGGGTSQADVDAEITTNLDNGSLATNCKIKP